MNADVRRGLLRSVRRDAAPTADPGRALAAAAGPLRRRLVAAYLAAVLPVVLLSAAAIVVHLRYDAAAGEQGTEAVVVALFVDPADVSLDVGEQVALSARVAWSDGRVADAGPDVTWTSAAEGTATVDGAGVATAVAPGTVDVSATVGEVSGAAIVRVRSPDVELRAITVEPSTATLGVGDELGLTALGEFSDGSRTALAVAWSTGDPAVAAVDDAGLVTALTTGRTSVVAEADGVQGRATVVVIVRTPLLVELTVTVGDSDLCSVDGDPIQSLDAKGRYDDGSEVTLTTQVSWSSDNPEVAAVDEKGLVTFPGGNGQATVTAALDGVTASTTYDCRSVD